MRADARAKRDQIVTAALAQIGTRSNSEITLEGIAADADVGIATLYRHFPTRAALYDACAIVFLERIESLLDELSTASKTIPPNTSNPSSGRSSNRAWASSPPRWPPIAPTTGSARGATRS